MTFCTVCAAPILPATDICSSCGALVAKSVRENDIAERHPTSRSNTRILRLLYLAPLALLLVIGATYLQRETAQQAWLASAYASAEDFAAAGDLVSARQAFRDLVGYRDADSRAQEMESRLAPLQAAYADGLRAIDQGEYATAVALLEPVAQQAPKLEDVAIRLQDAKRLLADELRRDVDAAQTVRDWPKAEATLRSLVNIDPTDANSRQQLARLQREHGPLVLGRDRSLWLISPDGGEERQLTDSLHVIWPTWSPDRSRIAFLAPDSNDPMGNVSLFVIGIDGGAPKRLVDGVSAHAAPAWSPDGASIAYTSFAGYDPVYESGAIGVRVVNVDSGVETDVTGTDYSLAFNPTWSPDGKSLAFVVKYQGMSERPQHSPGDVLVTKLGSDEFENLTNGQVQDVWSAAWSPRGDSLLLFSLFGQTWYEPPSTAIRELDRNSGAIRDVATVGEHPTAPVWSPDGSEFAFTADETTIVISDENGDRQVNKAEQALSGELTWSPDGLAILLAPWNADGPSTLVTLADRTPTVSTVRLEFDANPPFISPPQWAPAVAIPPADNPSLPRPEGSDESQS